MCGITGIFDSALRGDASRLRMIADRMADQVLHRGPDSKGNWIDEKLGFAFGHTRLSIVDLSSAGSQPMQSRCGRCTITYNGEIYNAEEMRKELASLGRTFRGHSDTEVIVEACAAFGVEATLKRLIGMFAFALWDRDEAKLVLARDRLGIKPLYWSLREDQLLFASELKSMLVVPGREREIDRQSLANYLTYSYVPSPRSIFKDVYKLQPGMLLVCDSNKQIDIKSYWSLLDKAEAGQKNLAKFSDLEATNELEELLSDAVSRRMVADVPLGALLSGGVDSSIVAALMQKASAQPVRTFSIGFRDKHYDEAQYAKVVAEHIGSEHTELYVSAKEAQDIIPMLPSVYDEPFADSSQIPTCLVSRLTREQVTVALSGDGGDELFAGYKRYGQGSKIATTTRRLPYAIRASISRGIEAVSPQNWDRALGLLPEKVRPRQAGDKLHKLAGILTENEIGYYRKLLSQWDEAWTIVNGAEQPCVDEAMAAARSKFSDDMSWMQYVDTMTYLPDDILTKVDRASMAVSLEARVPILDHRVVEFAWSLPLHMKIRRGTSKWILREVLYRHVPRQLIERPKMGFAVPLGDWLRGPLREWAEELLSKPSLESSGLIDPEPIRQRWHAHQEGGRNWQYFLWNILIFQAWQQNVHSGHKTD